ncbi:MAG TPA: phosphoribosyl-ATP diphosphatase [Firmicutes bacterium]|nr:phosphoribosyl-ATP diphosphatase [Bacillota bacterium]
MNDNILRELYAVISDRKENPEEGSYTCYLFSQGIDKILKKVGEESAETIIAAKNQNNVDLKNEVCDLIYHLLVMMKERDLPLEDVFEELEVRSHKIGNLKTMKKVDRNT